MTAISASKLRELNCAVLPKKKQVKGWAFILPERVLREIGISARKNGLQKVILFGSRARGTHTEKSDIDLAVIGGDFRAFYWDMNEWCHTLLRFDIVRWEDTEHKEIRNEIIKDGVVLYEKA